MLIFTFAVKGQTRSIDPVKTYLNDTTGFTKFPEVYLLGQLSLKDEYKTLELDTWVDIYDLYNPNHWKYQYRNLYRYPEGPHPTPDTTVLFRRGFSFSKCFVAMSPPMIFPWFIAGQTKTNRIISIGDTSELKVFIGKIKNEYDAYLWLYSHDRTLDMLDKTNP